jgi:hypothetical protein
LAFRDGVAGRNRPALLLDRKTEAAGGADGTSRMKEEGKCSWDLGREG